MVIAHSALRLPGLQKEVIGIVLNLKIILGSNPRKNSTRR